MRSSYSESNGPHLVSSMVTCIFIRKNVFKVFIGNLILSVFPLGTAKHRIKENLNTKGQAKVSKPVSIRVIVQKTDFKILERAFFMQKLKLCYQHHE